MENQHYITKWVEDNLIRNNIEQIIPCNYVNPKTGIISIKWGAEISSVVVNGVKETKTPGKDGDIIGHRKWIDNKTIQNVPELISNVIDTGIKETHNDVYHHKGRINGVIKHGIKETKYWEDSIIGDLYQTGLIDNVIREGKRVSGTFVGGIRQKENVDTVINYGIKKPTD